MELDRNKLIKLYTDMVRVRKMDDLTCRGLREGKVPGFFHSGYGEEAVGVGGCSFLRDDDFIYAHHRGHGLGRRLTAGGALRGRFRVRVHFGVVGHGPVAHRPARIRNAKCEKRTSDLPGWAIQQL